MALIPKKIVLVDRYGPIVERTAQDLRGIGTELIVTPDAGSAFAAARKFLPDAVVINSQLHGCDALFLLQRIRANVHTANLPVLVMAPRNPEVEREFLSHGAQECIAPPLSTEAIRGTVQRHMLMSLDFTLAPAEILQESERIAALQETGLLDSAPEESFDRLTRLASRLLGVSTALVSLVDKDRQFFKSLIGLGDPWAGARQTRLSHSFCQWVVAGKEEVVIPDAMEQPALRNNLAVKDMGVIAYAGVPLNGKGGHVIGSFCAIESRPRDWSEEDVETLRDLRQVCEAYAVLEQARRRPQAGRRVANVQTSMHVAGKAVIGVKRILARFGERLQRPDRAELLTILEEQGAHLVALMPDAN